jgi:hypothetical protein
VYSKTVVSYFQLIDPTENDEMDCKICFDNKINTVILPWYKHSFNKMFQLFDDHLFLSLLSLSLSLSLSLYVCVCSGHICVCFECSQLLTKDPTRSVCPICKQKIQQIVKTFTA